MRRVLVVGAGNFGSTLAAELTASKLEVIVIEVSQARAQAIRDLVTHVVVADATNKEVLEQFARDIDVAVVSLGEKIDSSILITHFLKELGVPRIVGKASSVDHARVLRIVGATKTIFPERDEAIRLATNLVSPDLLEFIRLSEEFNIMEVAVPAKFVNQSIADLNLRQQFGLQVLAVKNPLDDKFVVMPPPDYRFKPDDVMVVIGDTHAIERVQHDR